MYASRKDKDNHPPIFFPLPNDHCIAVSSITSRESVNTGLYLYICISSLHAIKK